MRYAELTGSNPLIHRKVVEVVHSLTDMVGVGREQIPTNVSWDAERLAFPRKVRRLRWLPRGPEQGLSDEALGSGDGSSRSHAKGLTS